MEVYLYQKGFVHAKTLVSDGQLAAVGTANMDIRSFDLNFEVLTFVYDAAIAAQLRRAFYDDLANARRILPEVWQQRSALRRMLTKIARLVSPLL